MTVEQILANSLSVFRAADRNRPPPQSPKLNQDRFGLRVELILRKLTDSHGTGRNVRAANPDDPKPVTPLPKPVGLSDVGAHLQYSQPVKEVWGFTSYIGYEGKLYWLSVVGQIVEA